MRDAIAKIEEIIEKANIDFEDFLVLLNAEEKTILKILIEKERAMNVNEIRSIIIDDFLQLIKYYGKLEEIEKEIEKINEKIGYKNGIIKVSPEIKRLLHKRSWLESQKLEMLKNKVYLKFWEGEFNDVKELFTKVYNELKEKGILKNDKILERDKRTVAELINKYGIARIPSYKTVERILRELEAVGIVVSRDDTVGRGRKLYAINPVLLKKLKEKKIF